MSRTRFRDTLYGRLFGRLLLAELAMLVPIVVVATTVAPPLFELNLIENGPLTDPSELAGAEAAFRSALWLGLAAGVVTSVAVSVVFGLALIRPLRRRLTEIGTQAALVAAGDYSSRVEVNDAGAELAALARSFNAMAAKLAETEAARRSLLADLAHEVRTPVTSISLTAEAISDGIVPADDLSLGSLTEQAGRLARLATDLRDIADAEGGLSLQIADCQVPDLLESARAGAAEAYAREGVALVVEEAFGVCQADPQRVGQVLANLLSNALRHTPSGGRVVLSGSTDGELVLLSVTDDGEGIAAEHLAKVFDRFYRTDSARARDAGGNGIGLSVSAEIARAHGGALTAASDGPGTGSRFDLTLPVRFGAD